MVATRSSSLNATRRPRDCEIETASENKEDGPQPCRIDGTSPLTFFRRSARASASSSLPIETRLTRIASQRGKRADRTEKSRIVDRRVNRLVRKVAPSTSIEGSHNSLEEARAGLITSSRSCLSGCTNRIQSTVQITAKRFEL